MSEREYLDVIAFTEEGREKKRKPLSCGYAYKNDKGDISVRIRCTPVPGSGWDGSFLIQPRREQNDRLSGSADRRAPSASRPAWGTSGHGNSAKHAAGGGDDEPQYVENGDDIPFISQDDTIRRWLR